MLPKKISLIILFAMKYRCLAIIVFCVLLLCSCVVTQSIDFNNKEGSTSLKANEFLVSVLEDLSCWTDQEGSDAFFDVAVTGVAKSIASSNCSRFVYINKSDDGSYMINFGFSNFLSLINQLSKDSNQDIVSIKEKDGYTTVSFKLSMENYESLKKIIPLLEDPNFEAYGPIYNNPPYDFRTEEDYLYMMEFIFGEGAKTIADSTINIIIDTPSSIISTTGTMVSDTSTSFEFRLIDFLLLHNPITFSFTY